MPNLQIGNFPWKDYRRLNFVNFSSELLGLMKATGTSCPHSNNLKYKQPEVKLFLLFKHPTLFIA